MKKWIMIIIGTLISIALVIVAWQWIYLKVTTKQVVYILPQGFKGVVLIAYGQEDGEEDVREDGKTIYRIPQNGILKLKRKEAVSLSQSWHYFEDSQGNRKEFYYCYPPCEEMKKNPDKIFAYGRSNGASLEDDYELRRTIFLVGTANDTDSLSKAAEKINAIELIKNGR
jgi:hypothetical protein